jgi:hypothetical protein
MENKPISYRWGKVKNSLPYVANISLFQVLQIVNRYLNILICQSRDN